MMRSLTLKSLHSSKGHQTKKLRNPARNPQTTEDEIVSDWDKCQKRIKQGLGLESGLGRRAGGRGEK